MSATPSHDRARRRLFQATALAWASQAALASTGSWAQSPRIAPAEVASTWAAAQLQGQGRLRFLGLHVYDIRLWSAEGGLGPADWPAKPLALEIEYARSLVGRLIAERSLEEMRRAGPLDDAVARRWLDSMTDLFPDVKAGDRITGLHLPAGVSRFFHNGQSRGEVRDAEFTRRFFGIWLADHSSEPALRSSLLGRR